MSINWFPGHMHKARKEIAKVMAEIDVIIEVLDARLPASSENPLVKTLGQGKPVLKILNKSDLADPDTTRDWLHFFNQQEGVQAIALCQSDKKAINGIFQRCKQMVPARSEAGRPVRTMIMGIPNVGKSTLINALLGRKIAKVGNEPAVTKTQQRYTTRNGLALSDTPGILWPKIEDPESGFRLAASGAIRDTAIEHIEVAMFAAGFLGECYPERLAERFKIKEISSISDEILEEIGRRRGCLKPGGIVDMNKAATLLLNELRSGKLGRISFETVAQWQERQRLLEARRQAALEEEKRAKEDDAS